MTASMLGPRPCRAAAGGGAATSAQDTGDRPPRTLSVLLDGIPAQLRTRPQWVVWRWERQDDKWTKIPVNARTGGNASSTAPDTWSAYAVAVKSYRTGKYAGVGYVFSAEDPFTGWDFDDCHNPETGDIDPWAGAHLALLNSYAEVSPSGTGVKAIVEARHAPGARKRTGQVETYDCGRFFTVTGHALPTMPATIEPRQEQHDALHAAIFPPAETVTPAGPCQPVDLGDLELLDKARKARNGTAFAALWDGDTGAYGSHSEADLALAGMLGFWTGGDGGRVDRLFRQSGLMRDKWDMRRGQSTYGAETVAKAVTGRTEFYTPSPTIGAPAAPPKPPEIPLDADISDTLRAYVERLAFVEEENTRLSERLEKSESELAELRKERSLYFGVLRNRNIPAGERITCVAALHTHASDRSRGNVDGEGFAPAPAAKIAEAAGQPESTVSRHLQRLSQDGLLERKIVQDTARVVDTETGEIIERPIERVMIRPPAEDLNTALQAAALAQPVRKRPGGSRPRCPQHPEAGTFTEWTLRCAECYERLDSGRIEHQAPANDDLPGSHNEMREPGAGDLPTIGDAPPGSHNESRETGSAASDTTGEISVHDSHVAQIGIWRETTEQDGDSAARRPSRPTTSPPLDLWKTPGVCLDCSAPLPPGSKYRCPSCAAIAALGGGS